jgi:glycosyltransferase involved in cell wall biosynthesis
MSTLRRRVLATLPPAVVIRLKRAKQLANLQRERFGRQQRRTNAMISLPRLGRRATQPGSVWGVCLARNEEDIIAHTVRHMLDQGLDGVIVVDNLSTDATRAVLDELAAADPRVHVGTDNQVGFHQGGKVSYLAHVAWRAGADWVVPFDADEFWYAEGESVASFLRAQRVDSVWCDFRNVYPTAEDGEIDLTRPRQVQVERREAAWMRVCFRARRWVWVGEGNHALRGSTETPTRGLHMLHYSYRSLEQYSRKVVHGVAALEAAGKDASIARHWRHWASLAPDARRALWRNYLAGDELPQDDPTPTTERVTIHAPDRWPSWDPSRVLS